MYWSNLPFLAVFALCAGLVTFVRGFRDLRIRRLVQNTPTSRIRSMAMGLVEIQGDVLERSAVTAPFSGHECAYWEVEIAARTRNGWNVVHRRNSGQPFFVTDGTGIAMVYPEGARCTVPVTAEEVCAGGALPECYARYLAEQRRWSRWLYAGSTLRFRERTLDEGDPVFILGTAEPRANAFTISGADADDDAALAASASATHATLAATGTDGAPAAAAKPAQATVVVQRTITRDGVTERQGPQVYDLDALPRRELLSLPAPMIAALGAEHAGRFGVSQATVNAGARPIPIPPRGPERVRTLHTRVSAVVRRGRNEPTFLISTQSETSLEESLAVRTFAKLVGGPALTVLGLAYLAYSMSGHH